LSPRSGSRMMSASSMLRVDAATQKQKNRDDQPHICKSSTLDRLTNHQPQAVSRPALALMRLCQRRCRETSNLSSTRSHHQDRDVQNKCEPSAPGENQRMTCRARYRGTGQQSPSRLGLTSSDE
jgi:hypothetical protein